jgi:hypothetical protein
MPPVYTADGRLVNFNLNTVPFVGFTGPISVATNGEITVVGAGPGGGPRVIVYNKNLGKLADKFIFEPTYRGGVEVAIVDNRICVTPKEGGGPVIVELDYYLNEITRYYAGNETSRTGARVASYKTPATPPVDYSTPEITINNGPYNVYLDYHGNYNKQEKDIYTHKVAELLARTGLFTVTTVQPFMNLHLFLTVNIGNEIYPRNDIVGLSYGNIDADERTYTRFQPRIIQVEKIGERTPVTTAHEIGHFFKLQHVDDQFNLMYGRGTDSRSVNLTTEQINTMRTSYFNYMAKHGYEYELIKKATPVMIEGILNTNESGPKVECKG